MTQFRFIDQAAVKTWYTQSRLSPSWALWIAIAAATIVIIMPLVLLVTLGILVGSVVFLLVYLTTKIITGMQAVLLGWRGPDHADTSSPIRVQVIRR